MKCDYPFSCGYCDFYDWEKHYCAYTKTIRNEVMLRSMWKYKGDKVSFVDAYFEKGNKNE